MVGPWGTRIPDSTVSTYHHYKIQRLTTIEDRPTAPALQRQVA
jgi:hypothetical protein